MGIRKAHYPLLAAVCAALFTTPLMMAGVNAILPEIGADLQASAIQLGLVGGAYSLGLAVFQLASGSLGDIWGHRRVFMAGGILFACASAIAGLFSDIAPFLALRLLQGIGAAMLSAAGLALTAAAAPPEDRPAYLGITGAFVYAGIACGPPVAGFITAALSWKWLFYINAISNLCTVLIMKLAPGNELRPSKEKPFDLKGCLLYAVAMLALTLAVPQISAAPLYGYLLLSVFLFGIILFIYQEHRVNHPILNLTLLRSNRVFSLSCLTALINYASFFGIIFFFSFYLQTAKCIDIKMAGLILAFQPFMQTIMTPFATRLVKKWQGGPASALGTCICGLGLFASAFLSADTPIYVLFIAQAFLGIGMSLFALANTTVIIESAGSANTGQASALTGAARTAGQLASMLLITWIIGLFLGQNAISQTTLPGFFKAMRISLVIFGLLNLSGVAFSLARNKIRPS